MGIRFVEGGEELLDRVCPLWIKLNEHHEGISTFFQDDISKRNYEQRKIQWLNKGKQGFLKIDLAFKDTSEEAIGYCVTIINEDFGEIDSLYVNENYRKMGIGSSFIERALEWLDENAVIKKRLNVATGNEQVLHFYQKFGFYPRSIILEQRN